MAYIEWFERGESRREAVGGKGASLAILTTAGFPVPAGFTLTTEAYQRFLESAKLGKSPDQETVRERFQATELPRDVVEAISAAHGELSALVGAAMAVRSSAQSEDGGSRSSAGLYESFLNVQGADGVLEAIRACYLSLWSARAVVYRGEPVGRPGSEAMAVVVMGLVACDTAGVAFTAHPVTGDRDVILINSNWGLGESVVSGMVTPDSFVVSKSDMRVLEREVFEKPAAIEAHAGGTGTREVALAREKTSAPSLSDEQALAVARMACEVEEHFGQPQDIEWGLTGSTLHLLQARPITTLN